MRTIFQLDPLGYPTELYTQPPDEDGSYPALTEEETAIPPPEGMYRRRFDRKRQAWVDEVTEAELYEMAYREKHRELVAAATEEFVAAKPGYTVEERLLQIAYDLYSIVSTGVSPGMSGEANELKSVFDTLYNKLVALEQTRQTRDRKKVGEIAWKS